ncbi:hypothetical protein AB0F45_37635, partial [Streptomyces achromogenes]|uniref:hypothetical protein n=1 Tax=Streptomyces achromogenes TaxID=67255 RepID=UPI003409D31E
RSTVPSRSGAPPPPPAGSPPCTTRARPPSWSYGRSLEWATSCPPPRHNFSSLPRIRSESPAFDLHHPEIAALEEGAR